MANNDQNNKNGKGRNNLRGILTLVAWALVLTVAFNYFSAYNRNAASKATSHEIKYSEMVALIESGKAAEVQFKDDAIYVTPVEGYTYTEEQDENSTTPPKSYTQSKDSQLTLYAAYLKNVSDTTLVALLREHNVAYTSAYETQMNPVLVFMMQYILPTIIMVGLLMLVFRMLAKNGGGGFGGIGSVGKSNAKVYMEKSTGVTFKDVAGQDEAKESLEEIIDFLHNPGKYTAIGAKLPKGALLVGSPGTGKTLLAKAVAGEADVAYLSISGSDFVEMYVGVGASRVRDLFDKAKKTAPCIVFIDEIDAVGRQRGAGLGGGHDEREQTLNQLLVEMDGFGANEGVIVIAATNRADILDKALLRPGRFDRQVYVGLPDIKGREEILKVHTRNKPLAPDVVLKTIAKSTAGFTGADLENLVNEAALLAAKRGRKAITEQDIEEASIKVVAGPEKKSRVVTEREKRLTSYHEAGHAITHYYCETADPVHEISIIPRGAAGGYTMSLPEEDKNYVTKKQMEDNIVTLLGGRVAEKLVLDDISTGASNDLERATAIARSMVMRYGFSERLGPVVYGNEPSETFLGRDLSAGRGYSETVASEIDAEIREMLDEAYEAARVMLSEHIDKLHTVAKALMEREKLSGEEFCILMEGGTLPPLDKDDAPRADAEKAEDEKSSAPRRRVSVHVKEPAVQEPASVQSETPSAEEAPKE